MLSFRLLPTFQIKVFQQISLPKFYKHYPNDHIKKTISVLEDSGKRQGFHTPELSIRYVKIHFQFQFNSTHYYALSRTTG